MVRVVTTHVVVMVIFGAMPTFAAEGQSTEPQPKLQIVTPVVESRPAIWGASTGPTCAIMFGSAFNVGTS